MTVFHAAPTFRHVPPEFLRAPAAEKIWAHDLQTAVNRARPGDEVVLLPGRYATPAVIIRSGLPDAPITLRAAWPGTAILDGGRAPTDGSLGGMDPLDADFAMLRLFFVDHWNIEDLRFAQCWPTCIYMRSATHVTIRNCDAEDGRYFVYLRQTRQSPTHHVTLQRCKWVQDPAHHMWLGHLTWRDVKGYTDVDATYFNGAFLAGFDVAGRIVVRDCDIRHAFNAIRFDMRDEHISVGPVAYRNRDVAIFDNSFSFIRDNAIEPEVGAQNWRVFNNKIYCAHASFSQDQVRSRDMFYIANTILNDHRPGQFRADGQSMQPAQGGKIHKWFKPEPPDANGATKQPAPRRGFWSLYNAVQTRTSYTKTAWTAHWHDAFTVIGLYPTMHPESTEEPRNPLKKINWDDVTIDCFVTDDAAFPRDYGRPKGRVTGVQVTRAFHPPVWVSDTCPDLNAQLGGWDGCLTPTDTVAEMRSETLTLDTFDGPIDLPSSMPLGTGLDVAQLGLGHWRMPWPDGPPGTNSIVG